MVRTAVGVLGCVVLVLLPAHSAVVVPMGEFSILPGESRVEFFVADNRGGFRGFTDRVSGTVRVTEEAKGVVGSIEATVDARGITTFLALRDRQMHRTYLRTDRYPEITFRGVAIPLGGGGAEAIRVQVRGELAIAGQTRQVEFPVRVWALPDRYVATGEVIVSMSAFGIPLPRFLIFVAEDHVRVTVRVVAVPRR